MKGPLKLRPMGLFAIICDAAFKDGRIEPFEQEILSRITACLKLDKEVARAIAKRSRERYKDGKLGDEKPLCPKIVYRHSLEVACADKTIDTTERVLLEALRQLFNISIEYHNEVLGRIREVLPPIVSSETFLPHEENVKLEKKASSILAALDKRCEPEPEVDLSCKRSAMRAAENTFCLKAAGMAVPVAVDLVLSTIGVIVFMGVFIALKPIFQGRNSGSLFINLIYLFFVFGSWGFYWVEKKRYQRKLLLNCDRIVIGLKDLTIPGCIWGEGKKITLSKADIDVFVTAERNSGRYRSLNFLSRDSSKVFRLNASAVDDINLIVKKIEEFQDEPISLRYESYLGANYQYFLSPGIILFSAALVRLFIS